MLKIKYLIDPLRIKKHWAQKYGTGDVSQDTFSKVETFRNLVERKWQEKETLIVSFFKKNINLYFEGEFNVFVLSPELEIAHYIDKENIEWGYNELYPNYIVIGIAHELIHCLTHDFYSRLSNDEKWVFHSLIYLVTDEELRFTLNGKEEYFTSPVSYTYHKKLINTAKSVLPYWKKHVQMPEGKNIIDVFNEIKMNLR